MSGRYRKHWADGPPTIGDATRGATLDWGATVPTDATPGYAPGCLFIDIDASGIAAWYINVGTNDSCDFDLFNGGINLAGLTATAAELNLNDGQTATAEEVNQSSDVTGQIVTAAATPLAITELLHNNRTIYITKTDGIAITLPVPVAGMKFKFVVGATITVASTIKSQAGTHLMIGHAIMGNDSDNTVVRWPALAASTYDTINLLGTGNSTGGIEGQVIEITALSTTRWLVEIVGDAAGTEATPFEDTVA